MKDRQIPLDGGEPRIPFVSAVLHCVAMTVIVFLRSSFGFVFLRPKSVFFAFSWAFTLFAIYAWNEPEEWRKYRAICVFGGFAMLLYWSHLGIAFARELGEKGRHDRYSGSSHAIRLLRIAKKLPSSRLEGVFHLWAEPAVVLALAIGIRWLFDEPRLSTWLFFAAGCLWCKEALNRWFEPRYHKRQKDIFDDAGETLDQTRTATGSEDVPKPTRKEKVKRARNPAE